MENNWIKLKEYTDILKEPCWVYTDRGNIYLSTVYTSCFTFCETQEVTHYQPIPKPSKPDLK